MEAIVCQTCDNVITYVEADKVGTLYAKCDGCDEHKSDKE